MKRAGIDNPPYSPAFPPSVIARVDSTETHRQIEGSRSGRIKKPRTERMTMRGSASS